MWNKHRKIGFFTVTVGMMFCFSAAAAHHGNEHHENEVQETQHSVCEPTLPEKERKGSYVSISQEDAHACFEENEDACIVDVRTAEEYEEEHIKGAILLPLDELEETCAEVLPDLDEEIYVYCRSGRRSKLASELLAEIGYTHIYEFGGILDWIYETEVGPYVAEDEECTDEAGSDIDDKDNKDNINSAETEGCQHEWIEDCISKTCSKCGEYHRITP